MTAARLHAGVAELEITPALGAPLVGELHVRAATGVAAPLLARALALADGERRVAIVTLDLAGLPAASVARIDAGAERLGLAPEALLLACSHTRGGPATAPLLGAPEPDADLLARVEAQALAALEQALGALQPAALGAGRATLPHLVYNHRLLTRNYRAISAWIGVPPDEVLAPEGPVDPSLSLLVVRDARGFPLCLLWSMAADIRFARDGQISPDLPGLVQQEVDRRAGRHIPCLYLPGCGGDVSYQHGLDAAVAGVASGVMAVQLETSCDPQVRLGAAREPMVLPIRDSAELWSRPDIELKWPAALDTFEREVAQLQAAGAQAVPAEIRALRLGPFAVVGLPGIPFASLGLALKERSPAHETLVVANSGAYAGPLPTRAAFGRGGYETWPARGALLGPGAGEFAVEQAARLLGRLWSRA